MKSVARSLLRTARCSPAGWPRSCSTHCGKLHRPKLVLGIETSCDDTGAAVVDEAGNVLGEALQCQREVHLK